MTEPAAAALRPGVRLGRKVLHQLRSALERDTGLQAASYLQEAGFAGGEELYGEFAGWLRAGRGVDQPADLDARYLGEALSDFFAELGWGPLDVRELGPAVLALDSPAWAEATDEAGGEFPSCHLTCGLLADFFGRLSDGLVAVMEVECRSRGDARCRFLAGAPETLSALYDRMAQGASYLDALGVSSRSGVSSPSSD
ncbi:MAG TPA: V4R domain-containing protein [Gemmatimonadales bacterium]|jgi:predicted hydrocarbon binding protein|nr:V4R domain-containing protein [Gemmatimonadales bacterium]